MAGSLTSEASLRVGRVHERSAVEGPGIRFAVWVQGCSVRCAGCFNPHLWTDDGGTTATAQQLTERAIGAHVEGVTLLGGEPFDQAPAVAVFAELVRDAGLSVMTFTGFELSHLRLRARHDAHFGRLIEATDLLIDGPYLADQPDRVRPWVGSRNQGFHFLTSRYKHLETRLHQLEDKLEIHVGADGTVSVNGWATVDRLEALLTSDVLSMPNRGRVL